MSLFVLPRQYTADQNGEPRVGALASFYAAGTATPITTYTTKDYTIAHANPVVSLGGGLFPAIYINPAVNATYKVVITDVDGVSVFSEDNVPTENSTLRSDLASTVVGSDGSRLVGVRRIETGSVARTVFAKLGEQMSVKDFGATGDGSTDDRIAIQRAIDMARTTGADVCFPPPAVYYRVQGQLDCSFSGLTPQYGYSLKGLGDNTVDSPTIFLEHTGKHGFDMSGARTVHVRDLTIHSHSSTYPEDCFFIARNTIGDSLLPRFTHSNVVGYFKDAILYNYAGEDGLYLGNYWNNRATDANVKTVILTNNNIRSKSSDFMSILSGGSSCIDHQFIGGCYLNQGGHTTSDVFEFENAHEVELNVRWLGCFNPNGNRGRSLVLVNTAVGASDFLHMPGVMQEEALAPKDAQYFIRVTGSAGTCSGWDIRGARARNNVRFLEADAGINFSACTFEDIFEAVSKGILIPGTFTGGRIDANCPLNIGVVNYAQVSGQSEAWTLPFGTANMVDVDFNDRTINSTWTPGTGALTVVGGLTVQAARYQLKGKYCHVLLQIAAGTSVACAAGTQITGLPFAAKYSGSFTVTDSVSYVQYGGGIIGASALFMPQLVAGTVLTHPLVIEGRYRVS